MVYTDVHLPLPGFIALDWTLMIVALIPIILRLSLRMRNRGLDPLSTNIADGFVVLAWLAGSVLISINTWKNNLRLKYIRNHTDPATLYYGVPEELSGHLLYVSWISLFFIYISLWASKAAFLAFYYSIFSLQGKRARITLAVACVFTAATFLLHIFLIAFWCSPISSNWSPPPGEHLCSAVHSISSVTVSTFTNIATDIVILAIPISTLLTTKLGRTERAGLAFVFLMGSVSIVAALVRFITLKIIQGVPKAEITHTIDVWALVEIVSSILAVCLPSLRAFVRRHSRHRLDSNNGTTSHTSSMRTRSWRRGSDDSVLQVEHEGVEERKWEGAVRVQEIWLRDESGQRVGLGLVRQEREVERLVYVRRPEEVRKKEPYGMI
ncbi:hypothetical protein BDV96DRAFT_211808 [Lophiotrema nucula]|uniref:Rhodopsin domain-containing protein n=1 Tax=Lophiotrema nucula TaxID=690887 RepID=A0A6A5ZRD0_9PLEO|nr:hypothetical protein BDV96DRAFT_211808 [Lophiotrema nucula]